MRQHLEQHPNGIRDFAHILSYIVTESIESVISACDQAIKIGTISKDAILNILLRKKDELPNVLELSHYKKYHTLKHIPKVDCSSYDNLLKLGGKQ